MPKLPSPGPPDHPVTAWEFCKLYSVDPTEGLVVAQFPPKITGLMGSGEHYYYAQWVNVRLLLGEMDGLGTRVLDLLPDPLETKIKWWKVRDFTRGLGYNLIPEAWNGAARDLPAQWLEPGSYTGIRMYSAGPWIWPVLRPEMVLEEDPDETKMHKIVETYKL